MSWITAHRLNPDLAGALLECPQRMADGRVVLHEPLATVVPGEVCEAARRHYAHGQCALLALALLAERSQARAIIVHPLGEVEEWMHAMIELPERQLVDIDGLRQARSICRQWNEIAPRMGPFTLSRLSDQDAARLLGRLELAGAVEREVAATFARSLLTRLEL